MLNLNELRLVTFNAQGSGQLLLELSSYSYSLELELQNPEFKMLEFKVL